MNCGYAAVLMLSLVVFVEILVNFKRRLLLKTLFLLLAFCFMWRSAAELYTAYAGYNRWIAEPPGCIIGASALWLFSEVYQSRARWYIIAFGIFMVALQLSALFYYSLIDPVDVHIHTNTLPGAVGRILTALRTLIILVMMLVIGITLKKILKKYQKENIYFARLKAWTIFFTLIVFFLATSHIINTLTLNQNKAGALIFLFGNYAALLLLLFRPRFLNYSNLKISLSDSFSRKSQPELNDSAFIEAFFNKAYYLDKDASAEGLARLLDVSTETVQEYVSARYGSGFTDLVNRYRVSYFVDLVSTGHYENYTIDALAREAGFNSRHHLYKPFKKFHGGTPSDFLRSVFD
jgi:AraC-like DNA-binding protein